MSVSDSLSAAIYSRRRVMTWAATAVAAGATLKIPGVFAVAAAQESADVPDATVIHDIKVSFDQAIYDAMIETFKETGDKEWIQADIIIDGSAHEKSAMRLKGNSSLGGLGGMRGGGGPINMIINEDGTPVSVDPEQFLSGDGTPEANSPDGGG